MFLCDLNLVHMGEEVNQEVEQILELSNKKY